MGIEGRRLNNEEAQEEANMLRASIGVSPETGKVMSKGEEREPTKEDYQKALETLNDLQKSIADYRDSIKHILHTLAELNQLPIALSVGFNYLINALKEKIKGGSFTETMKQTETERKEVLEQIMSDLPYADLHKIWQEAEKETTRLQEEAKKFEKPQN